MTARISDIADIYVCGWRLRTGMPLPAALAWPDAATGRPDVTFIAGAVPTGLPEPVVDRSVLQIAADGTALVRFEGIGRFLVCDETVTRELEVPLDAPELAAVIFGNVLACICWQRGQLALHGSAVAVDGRAVLLLGRAEAGKSLLAAALVRRGHCALGDEVAVVSGATCLPAGAPLMLADDVLAAIGIDSAGLPQYWNFKIAKRLWASGPAPEPRPYPVAAVICLSKSPPEGPIAPERLSGDAAVGAILNQVFWRDMLRVLDSEADARREAIALSAAGRVYQFPVPRSLDRSGEAAAAIESLIQSPVLH